MAQQVFVGWEVPGKNLTIPQTVSPQMRSYINYPPWKANPTAHEPDLHTATVFESNEQHTAWSFFQELNVTVEEVQIAGVRCYTIVPAEASTQHMLV